MSKINFTRLSKKEARKKGAHYDIFVEATYTHKLIKTEMKKEIPDTKD